jgi:hypothetical protein
MDQHQFDRLARSVSSYTSRRKVLGLLSASAMLGLPPRRAVAAQDAQPATLCGDGQTDCPGSGCVDLCCNNDHCGACGNACTGGFTCFEGVCDCPSGLCCAEGEVLCGETCVATCCDNNNCGACGNVCTGGLTCFEGVCDCPSGNCGPYTPPNTGIGSGPQVGTHGHWMGAAVASAAAAAIAIARRRQRPEIPVAVDVKDNGRSS